MIHIDDRKGSKHLLKPLLALGLPAELLRMEFGDIAFNGSGPNGDVAVGIELKKFDDLVGSLTTQRFQADQLPGMLRSYQWPILMVEGLYRESSEGLIERGVLFGRRLTWMRQRSMMTYQRLEGTLMTLTFCTGFRLMKTRDTDHTVAEIARLYRWWQKPWAAHQSHHVAIKQSPAMAGAVLRDPWFNRERHFLEAVALQIPGLGKEKALAAAKHFKSLRAMAWASPLEWQSIPGIGKVLAQSSHDICRKRLC